MTNSEAASIILDAFRGIRCRLQRDGLLDFIVARMAPVLVSEVTKERESCAQAAEWDDCESLAAAIRSR